MEDKKIAFSLIQIKTDQFSVFEENHLEKGKINLNASLTFGLNSDDNVFLVTSKFTFEMKKKPFISVQVSCFFKIEEETWNTFISTGKFIFPRQFVTHMAMLTVGTTRGVLHSKTEKTIFNKYIIPTTDVVKMVSEDVIFN